MRTFIAIDLPENLKQKLGEIQKTLQETQVDIKWVEPYNMHLTLKFLGEVELAKLERIKEIIKITADSFFSYELTLSSLGAFPRITQPRVIWIGVNEKDKNTEKIAEELETRLTKLGIAKEKRPFSSHITLGRVRSNKNLSRLLEKIKYFPSTFESLHFGVNKINLYKSTLTPKGSIYETIFEANLKNA